MYTYFKTETVDHSIGRLLSEKKHGGTATSSYSATDEFSQHIYSVLVAKNDQKIRSRCLVHEFFFTGIVLKILIMVTEQLYWRKTLCGCFRFIWLWLLIAIMKRCAERMWRRSFCLGNFMQGEWLWRWQWWRYLTTV